MILRLATHAMGTRFELVLAGGDEPRLRAAGEAAIEEIEEQDRRLSLFGASSLVARVNRLAHAEPVLLDADTFELFRCALEVREATGGAFDVTVADRMAERGFHTGSHVGSSPRSEPGRIELDAERRTIRLPDPGTAVDLGGIAKGHALDLAAEVLREAGVEDALVHGGTSSVIALGAPPDAPGWRVALGDESAPVAVLRDAGLAVSAARGRTLDDGSGHVLDPRDGSSVPADRISAVHAPSARLANAFSTALLVNASPAGLDPAATAALFLDGSWTIHGASPDAFVYPSPLPHEHH